MTPPDELLFFRTLRGFLGGEEPDEENYFRFSATLRIFGEDVPFEDITGRLGVKPTHQHRKGERRGSSSHSFRDDAWHFQPAIPEAESLGAHLDALWVVIAPQVDFLRSLKSRYSVDVFCGYRSNCDTAGFEVPHESLQLFAALEIPFGVSVVIA